MAYKKKHDRITHPRDLANIAKLAAVLRTALDSPERRACTNPGDDESEHQYIDDVQAGRLAVRYIELLAEYGTPLHQEIDPDELRIRDDFRALRRAGTSHQASIAVLVDCYPPRSARTLERIVATAKK